MAPPLRTSRSRFLRRLCALGIGFALALVGLEVMLRATEAFPLQRNPLRGFHDNHSTLGWIGMRDYAARFRRPDFDVVIEHDSDGFRASSRDEMPAEDAPRVVFLGDSFLWGWGVAQGEVLADRLQELLDDRVRVVGRGLPGWSTSQQRLFLEHFALQRPTDIVVVLFCGFNDLRDSVDDKGGRRPCYELVDGALVARNLPVRRKIAGTSKSISRRSLALSFLEFNVNTALANLRDPALDPALASPPLERLPTDPPLVPPEPAPDDPRYWPVMHALLVEMRELCTSAGSELRLAYIPSKDEVAADVSSQTAVRTREVCDAESIPFLDLTPGLRAAWKAHPAAQRRATPVYFGSDAHWTAFGHSVVARELAEGWAWPE